MELVYGAIAIIAGIVYILWQTHKEAPGFLTFLVLFSLGVIGYVMLPHVLELIIPKVDYEIGVVIGVVFIILHLGGFCWFAWRSYNGSGGSVSKEVADILAEMRKLPYPDAETLRKYKIANKIPLYPEDDETYNSAAYQAWWNDEYNKRLKDKCKFIVH